MNIGVRLNDSRPCAMVLPPGISASARSWSTWIHCSSQVASANLLMRSCVTSIQSLTPTTVPTAAFSSSNPLKIRMALSFKSQPDRKCSCNLQIAIELQRSAGHVAPISVAKIDFDVITDIAAKCKIDGKSRVLHADVDAGSFEDQPHDSKFRAARRHARKFKAQDDAAIRQRARI